MSEVRTYQLKHLLSAGIVLVKKSDEGQVTFYRRIEFAGGALSPRLVPGKFVTGDPQIQELIENHPEYGKVFGRINLNSVRKPAEPAPKKDEPIGKTEEPPAEEVNGKVKDYPDVTYFQAAAKILRDDYGVESGSVRTKKGVIESASQVGVSFPNLK